MIPEGMFVDREEELAALNKWYEEGKPEFILMYGRRRVGKTRLIEDFIKGKDALYFIADRSANILDVFARSIKDRFVRFCTWDDFFDFLAVEAKDKRLVVVIDEFQYLYDVNKAWPTIVQRRLGDLKKTKIMLVLCGSIISTIYRIAMGYGSAFYGRKTHEMEVRCFDFLSARKMLPSYSIKDSIYAYAILGGVPRYLEEFEDDKSIYQNIEEHILDRNSFLYREPLNLFYEEFKNPSVYLSVLSILAEGPKRFSEISTLTGIAANKLPKYLSVLERVRIIEKDIPVTERARTRNTRYILLDNFMGFFFRFVYPERSLIELGERKPVLERIKKELDGFTGYAFERMCREFLLKEKLSFTRIGKWWHKEMEIDVVALDGTDKKATFFECKWQDMNEKEALNILEKLKENAGYVEWHSRRRKERYGIIARKIEGKEELRKKGYLVYDLEDF